MVQDSPATPGMWRIKRDICQRDTRRGGSCLVWNFIWKCQTQMRALSGLPRAQSRLFARACYFIANESKRQR